jgi:hypothetical protein
MTFFAIYDAKTGAIKRSGLCSARDVALQAQEGEAMIETDGSVRDNTHVVDLTKTPPVAVLKPAPAAKT